jgi:hypothetical protein
MNLSLHILQLPEKLYRSLDSSTRKLRFALPFPMLAYPFYLVRPKDLWSYLTLMIDFLMWQWMYSNVMLTVLFVVFKLSSGRGVQGSQVRISTQAAICFSQTKRRIFWRPRHAGLPWLASSLGSPLWWGLFRCSSSTVSRIGYVMGGICCFCIAASGYEKIGFLWICGLGWCPVVGGGQLLTMFPCWILLQIFVMWLDFVTYLHHHGHNDKLPWYRGKVKLTELQPPDCEFDSLTCRTLCKNLLIFFSSA